MFEIGNYDCVTYITMPVAISLTILVCLYSDVGAEGPWPHSHGCHTHYVDIEGMEGRQDFLVATGEDSELSGRGLFQDF